MSKALKVACMFVISICLTSCAGTGDWSYKLPNNYEVCHIHSKKNLIEYSDLISTEEGIPSFVKEFSYNERYVFTRNVESIDSNNIFDEKYYVLDTEEKKVYNPCRSIDELKELVKQLEIEIPTKWYRTSPDPNVVQ